LLVPGWTLNFEMFFYAIFGALLFLPDRNRLAPLAVLFLVLTGAGVAFGPFDSAAAQTYTHPMLLEFAAGAAIGVWWLAGRWHLPVAGSLSFIAAGATMLMLRDHEPMGVATQIFGAVFTVIGALDAFFKAWQSRWLRALGDSSYSLYLTHLFTLGALRVVWSRWIPSMPDLPATLSFMILALVVCALVGWLTYRWVETPLLHAFSSARKGRAVSVAASS
jgi:exopolysaccharide production protein ExoZ